MPRSLRSWPQPRNHSQILLALALLVGCHRDTPAAPRDAGARAAPPPVDRAVADAGSPAPGRAATARARAESLVVPDHEAAVLVPPTRDGPRPVLIVLHGMGDDPSSICPAFDLLAAGRAWILCPRGTPFPGRGWTYRLDRRKVAAEVHAGLDALVALHGARVDPASPVIAGFSLGAMFAAVLARAEPAAFPRALVIDTHRVWTPADLANYARRGGRAVSFFCSRSYVRDCPRLCGDALDLPAAPIPTRCRVAAERGHGYDRALFDLLAPDFAALVATDPRW